jgi:predicted NBD/HSP70 family sugar kinase
MAEPHQVRPGDRRLLDLLGQRGELRRSELAQLSGLPRSTITDALIRLQRAGQVVERPVPAPPAAPRPGRPPRVVALAPPTGLAAVIALTHGTLQAGVVGFDGTVRARAAVDAYVHDLPDGVIEPGLALLDRALAEISAGRDALTCAVVSLPMAVIPGRGLGGPTPSQSSTDRPGRRRPTPDWARTDPSVELARRLGVPAWLENDANLGALGEAHHGVAAGMASFIYVKIVQGIGAGIILDGRLHRGTNGLAGELAHIHMQDDGAVCACGGRGCLATVLNTVRFVDLIQSVHPGVATMADVLSLAADGDPGVGRLLRDIGRTVGRSLADFCVYLAPDGIVLDGLLENAGIPVIDGINEMLGLSAPPAVVAQLRVAVGLLGEEAELHGAAVLARHRQFGLDPVTW